jgi:general secretion pathway protein A
MRCRPVRWIGGLLGLWVATQASGAVQAGAEEREQLKGVSLTTIIELETTARLLAVLLDSGRSVINDNQTLFDDQDRSDKGFTPEVFERQLHEQFRNRAGVDLQDLNSARIPALGKSLIKDLVDAGKQVVADAQVEINRKSVGFKGFIPAVFGERVGRLFTAKTGVRLKQTALVVRNPGNAPDAAERVALETFSDPSYPREKVITEVTRQSKALLLLFPLYTTRHCLDCHGEPKGQLDRTGYPREGLKLGQNAGAISVMIPLANR